MPGRTLPGISAGAGALPGTGDGAAGCEGPAQVPDGHTHALSSLPPWHSRDAEQHPSLKTGKMPHVWGRDAAEGKAAWSLQDRREAKLPQSWLSSISGFLFPSSTFVACVSSSLFEGSLRAASRDRGATWRALMFHAGRSGSVSSP